MSEKVQLHLTWAWDCPRCDTRNITNGMPTREMTEDELEDMGAVDGTAMLTPEEVTCMKCLSSFEVDFSNMEEL